MIQTFFPQPPLDLYKVYLRRQGWTVTQALTYDTDPRVIKVSNNTSPHYTPSKLYEFLSRRTVRELLRAIFYGSSQEDLLKICSNKQDLDEILSYLEADGIATRTTEGKWEKGPACLGINDIGATLEWLVAEWFRSKLLSPAYHGVCIDEVPRGGDLDVVAMVNDLRVWVECKSRSPQNISKTDLRWFIQRAHDFNPEMAVLLIDTSRSIEELIRTMNDIYADMALKRHMADPALKDKPPTPQQDTFQPRYKKELWWGARNVFVTNVTKTIEASMMAVLRLYHSEIRHLLYLWGTPEYSFDYVAGKVTRLEE